MIIFGVLMKFITIFALFIANCSFAEDVNKCMTESGQVTFQSAPCSRQWISIVPPKSYSTTPNTEALATEMEFSDPCGSDASCLTDSWWLYTETKCPKLIEKLAKWDLQWTDGFLESKFNLQPIIISDNVIRFYGDALKMQNGFGAWSNVIYYCDINIERGVIVSINANKGRL